MIRWLIENVGLILLAFILAIVVWVAAEWEKDPILEKEFDQPISVRVVNHPPNTSVAEIEQEEVRVRLRAPQSVWDQLSAKRFDAVLDLSPNLSPLEPGSQSVPVNVSVNLEPVEILEIQPPRIEIDLEAMRERSVPVQVQVRGEPDQAYQAGEPIVVSDTVKVYGPASQVDQVNQATTSVFVQGQREDVKEEAAALTPIDASGKRVSGVTLTPDEIEVRVPITQRSNFKEVTVKPEILGQPAPDYYVANVRLNPSRVMLIGSSPSILDDLPGFLTTVPISIQGRTEDIVERLPLELPAGVATVNLEQPAVQVTIDIEPFPGSMTVTRTVTFQGLQPNLMAIASPEVVEVILSGSLPRLSALLQEDVRVILDLSGLGLGDEEQLEPVVVQPEGITVDSVIPSVIQVRIVREAWTTPTPETQE